MAIPFLMINLDKPRKLRFGMGAMVEFEQLTGIKLASLNEEMSMETCAKIIWVMLRQEDKDLTLEDTCKLIDDYAENIEDITTAATDAITIAFQGGNQGGNKAPNSRKPKNQTQNG